MQGNKTQGEGDVNSVLGNKTHGEGFVNCVQGSKTHGEGVVNCVYLQTCFYIWFYTTFHLQQLLQNGFVALFNTAAIFETIFATIFVKLTGKEG